MKIDKDVGFPELLFLVLFVLKWTGHFEGSWWVVYSPLWGYWGLIVAWYGLERLIKELRKPTS